MRGTRLQAEVVVSLGLVMLAATGVLAAVLVQGGEARLRDWLGPALLAEARALPPPGAELLPGTVWWRVTPGAVRATRAAAAGVLDTETAALAEEAGRTGRALLRPGAPWDPIRFAAPDAAGGAVLAARVPAATSARLRAAPIAVAAAVLVLDVLLFTAFGASLLRRRVVEPWRQLAAATRAVADGALEARLPLEGPREAIEVASAFNEMSESLATRTAALEKAVVELRDANRDLRRAREGLDRNERLASVGRLAAGVAHEVGNPMGAILALLSLVERDEGLGEASRRHLARAGEQGERVRRILRQLLDFSRPPRMERVPLDLGALVEEATGLVRAQDRYAAVAIGVDRDDAGLPPAEGDPAAVSQILLNLLLNACDAAIQGERPRVRLGLRPAVRRRRAGDPVRAPLPVGRVDAVECLVADTGPGIPEEDRERIFDPFYTSKPPGEGTGLGLPNSLRLAEEMGGALELVDPPAGFATALVLRLPCASGPATACGVRSGMRCEPARPTSALERESE